MHERIQRLCEMNVLSTLICCGFLHIRTYVSFPRNDMVCIYLPKGLTLSYEKYNEQFTGELVPEVWTNNL